jgi:hypothetical protein
MGLYHPHCGEVDRVRLALKLKDVIAEKARKHQSIVGGDRKSLSQEVVKAVTEPIHTDKELGKIAGVSHETIAEKSAALLPEEDTRTYRHY